MVTLTMYGRKELNVMGKSRISVILWYQLMKYFVFGPFPVCEQGPWQSNQTSRLGLGWRQIIHPCFTELWLLGLGENFSTMCYADCNGNGPKPINLRAVEVWILTLTLAPEMPFCNVHTVYHFDSVFPVSFFFLKKCSGSSHSFCTFGESLI